MTAPRTYTIAIVGASSLKGKELKDALTESVFAEAEFFLFDDDETLGQLEAVGDEMTFVRALTPGAFERVDFAFFCGTPEQTRKFWREAQDAGASVLDLSFALGPADGAVLMAPWMQTIPEPRLDTPAYVIGHPAVQMIALAAERIAAVGEVESLDATLLEPASEYDRGAMDELHQQTVKLLSFQPLPQQIYDTQAAFNLLTATSDEAKVSVLRIEDLVREQYDTLGGLPPLHFQVALAPVFHGYIIPVHVVLSEMRTVEMVKDALRGPHIELVNAEESPSNLSVAGQTDVLVRVRPSGVGGRDFLLWVAGDNLRLMVATAVDAASNLRALRPRGIVQ
jgi:aspartate-semialdehyde dehydrogenase